MFVLTLINDKLLLFVCMCGMSAPDCTDTLRWGGGDNYGIDSEKHCKLKANTKCGVGGKHRNEFHREILMICGGVTFIDIDER